MLRNSLCAAMVCSFVFFVAQSVQAQDEPPKHEIEAHGIYSIPSGDASFTKNGLNGSTVDFSRDFDFRNELGYEIRYTYKSTNGKHKLLADFADTNWERTRSLSRSFTFL